MTTDYTVTRALRTVTAFALAGIVAGCAGHKNTGPVAYAPPPPPPQQAAPQIAPTPAPAPQARAPRARAPQAQPRQVAVGGTAFPADGVAGAVPAGSRLVVRVYDAAGGDVNIRAAEGAFQAGNGLPLRYELPVSERDIATMELPAVAARLEGPRGGVLYRNETAVLLVQGKPGDIPMTRQRVTAASAVTREWTAPRR